MKIAEAAALLRRQDNILILTHKRPDGDTVGCAAGLCAALRNLGKRSWVLPNRDITALFAPYLEGYLSPADVQPDFVVSVDVAGRGMFTPEGEVWLARGIDLAFDHHPSQEFFAEQTCLDAGRAACGELLYDLVRELGPVTAEIAGPLYVAVSTDCGCFQYGNTTPATHRVAAALMDAGIDYAGMNKRHFRTKSFKRLKIESMIVEGMHLYENGRIAVAPVPLSMMAAVGATENDMEDIAAFVGQVEGVETSVTIREQRDGRCKMSVRTSGGLNATRVCALLGGGGHAAAAGCTIPGTVEDAERAILEAIRQVAHG
jgi:phosphoesterase RecJ-like protein